MAADYKNLPDFKPSGNAGAKKRNKNPNNYSPFYILEKMLTHLLISSQVKISIPLWSLFGGPKSEDTARWQFSLVKDCK